MCADLSLIFCNIACSPSSWLLAIHSATDDTNATTREIDTNINIDINININININNNCYNNNNIDINNNYYYKNCHKESESSATVDSSVYHSCGGHYHYHFQYHCNQQSLLKYELPASTMISDSQNPKISFGTATTYDTANDTENDTENEYLLPPQASTLPEAAAALSPCVRNVQKILGPRPYYLDSYLETTDSQRKREERKWRDLRRQRQKRRWKRLLGELVRSIAPWKSSSSSSS